jgi:hypothetical protein
MGLNSSIQAMNFNNVLKYRIFILLIAYIGLQILLLYQFGIVTHFEAAKYIDQAHNLILREQYTSNNFFFYSTQILLIAVCIKLKIGFWFIVLLQIIANAFSLFLFHQLVKSITGRRFIAFGATLFFWACFTINCITFIFLLNHFFLAFPSSSPFIFST